jgi:hypothetical protein
MPERWLKESFGSGPLRLFVLDSAIDVVIAGLDPAIHSVALAGVVAV